ncbi:ABC transporter permease [Nonomuraea sp. K274]|uniref:ABC transporter permease n=1 Tax=Nonomuraea cypriaca TaxID=1187855 RepID=A0A931A6K2_9ACTN|nr:ABC transporter permease [Nonomuraea cypriaca]MBF8184285.1 ABC transporter permease [Nonomuraea cypriaca]
MLRTIARNIAEVVVTLILASFLIFIAMYLAPGDKAALLAGGPENLSPQTLAAINAQYHFDEPVWVQYGYWLGNALGGDFGRSYVYGQNVSSLLGSRMDVTLVLVLYTATIVICAGVVLGVVSALRRRRPADSVIVAVTTFLGGVPPFVAAVALIGVFSTLLGWFPTTGAGDGLLGRIHHLTLPALALAVGSIAGITRVTRQSMVGQQDAPHVDVARTRGLPYGHIVRQHLLRNSLAPIITMAGLVTASTIAGTVIVEQAFGLSGVGKLLIDAIDQRDLPVTQAVLLFLVLAYIVTTRIADVLQRLADPRLRESAS